MDVSLPQLRVLREIADRGTFTAAAEALGYTQSAVSRQVAALERQTGTAMLERHRGGARVTAAGSVLLRHARTALDALDDAERELAAGARRPARVRLGIYLSAGATLLPRVATTVRRRLPGVDLVSREGTSPALVRAIRAGTLDLAVVTARPPYAPPDAELPRLVVRTLAETELLLAVPADGPWGRRDAVTVAELTGADWIAGPASGTEPTLGVWPGLAGRPRVVHTSRDWLVKLRLVASGAGVTTVPADLAATAPDGVAILRVADATSADRRALRLLRAPGQMVPEVAAVARVVREEASATVVSR